MKKYISVLAFDLFTDAVKQQKIEVPILEKTGVTIIENTILPCMNPEGGMQYIFLLIISK